MPSNRPDPVLPRIFRGILRLWGKEHLAPFVDSLVALGRPSEVAFPPELLEQGLSLALSGISNTVAIQSNTDWVWPGWVRRQTDPEAPEFVPTGLNLLTTNLTSRNWTSIGLDGSPREGMVDPSGALCPEPWGWSIVPWLDVEGRLLSSWSDLDIVQDVAAGCGPGVRSRVESSPWEWSWTWEALEVEGIEGLMLSLRLDFEGEVPLVGEIGFAIRPCNTLSMGQINRLEHKDRVWSVNGRPRIFLPVEHDRFLVSDRHHGDPLRGLGAGLAVRTLVSRSGIATALSAWRFRLEPGQSLEREVFLPLDPRSGSASRLRRLGARGIAHARERTRHQESERSRQGVRLRMPDPRLQEAFDAVRGRLHVFDDQDRYSPGTFLYHHHWFRDAAFLALGFENMGLGRRTVEKLGLHPSRQTKDGFYRSQSGEWDSNGQALWTVWLHVSRGGRPEVADRIWASLVAGADWIERMRRRSGDGHHPHRGLLPAGFSAEHFGPNDHYLWDNFWSLAGLRSAARLAGILGRNRDAERLRTCSEEYGADLAAAIQWSRERAGGALPCSPYRRMDAAAVGNLVAVSPLGIASPDDPWVGPTLEHLMDSCFRKGLFFHPIVHTGLNPYLSVQVARVLLARGDRRHERVMEALLDAATPTWCWPEAIHPSTGGGCMGDGDHGWAAAEFLSLCRDRMVREDPVGLLLLDGVPRSWFSSGEPFGIQGAPTEFGTLDIEVVPEDDHARVEWRCVRAPHQSEGRLFLSLPANGPSRRRIPLAGPSGQLRILLSELSRGEP
ncbi:MAG: hypothetical protein H6686_05590 [Fibrobacteria bacterium]|nr:hypothetical protein [Fibrobacteria bacterium]